MMSYEISCMLYSLWSAFSCSPGEVAYGVSIACVIYMVTVKLLTQNNKP